MEINVSDPLKCLPIFHFSPKQAGACCKDLFNFFKLKKCAFVFILFHSVILFSIWAAGVLVSELHKHMPNFK